MAFLTHSPASHSRVHVGRVPSPFTLVAAAARVVSTWVDVARERRALREMGMSRLEDLGLTDADVKREASKPFFWTRRV